MWTLGGLSLRELLARTARESWRDAVFGQAARLAFYHFLAICPILFLLLIPLTRLAGTGEHMRGLLSGSFAHFLPNNAALLVAGALDDLTGTARHGGALLLVAVVTAFWAATNASWAMIEGLNRAYETEEDRDLLHRAAAAVVLAFAVIALVFAALLITHVLSAVANGFRAIAGIAQWAAIVLILLVSFALFYRFGPNLRGRKWEWSTPGAVFAAALWLAFTVLLRDYFNQFKSYEQVYGRIASAAVLMMWLYMTSATVLIGAEMNSEIEKDRERDGAEQTARKTADGRDKPV